MLTRPPTPDLLAALVTLDLLIETNEELTVQWRELSLCNLKTKPSCSGFTLNPEHRVNLI